MNLQASEMPENLLFVRFDQITSKTSGIINYLKIMEVCSSCAKWCGASEMGVLRYRLKGIGASTRIHGDSSLGAKSKSDEELGTVALGICRTSVDSNRSYRTVMSYRFISDITLRDSAPTATRSTRSSVAGVSIPQRLRRMWMATPCDKTGVKPWNEAVVKVSTSSTLRMITY